MSNILCRWQWNIQSAHQTMFWKWMRVCFFSWYTAHTVYWNISDIKIGVVITVQGTGSSIMCLPTLYWIYQPLSQFLCWPILWNNHAPPICISYFIPSCSRGPLDQWWCFTWVCCLCSLCCTADVIQHHSKTFSFKWDQFFWVWRRLRILSKCVWH